MAICKQAYSDDVYKTNLLPAVIVENVKCHPKRCITNTRHNANNMSRFINATKRQGNSDVTSLQLNLSATTCPFSHDSVE